MNKKDNSCIFGFCLACEAEARHMYCFSGVVVVVVVVVGGGVNFFVFRARAMELGSCIHLMQVNPMFNFET